MSSYEDRKVDFLFCVFEETNEHIRATDEKNVLIGGSFIALIAVVITILIDKIKTISWTYLIFSLFILVTGSIVLIIQLWYRKWKEHYLDTCHNIASQFKLEKEFLPCWLREQRLKNRFSADKFLIVITALIILSVFFTPFTYIGI